ncbi:MAG: hypothetical protein H6713_04965 [Myxococcales bacterium]|nr:hypothetical protein [Myxococcales bacterium]
MALGTHALALGLSVALLADAPVVAEGPAPAPAAPPVVSPPSRRDRQLLTLGAVSTTLGGAAVITGVVLATRPEVPLASDPMLARSYKPAGVTAAVVGAAVLATGVVMLIAALSDRRAHHRQDKSPAASR